MEPHIAKLPLSLFAICLRGLRQRLPIAFDKEAALTEFDCSSLGQGSFITGNR